MTRLAFWVPGEPVAKGRGKVAVVNGHARVYTPAKTRRFEARVREAAQAVLPEGWEPLTGAVHLAVNAFWEWPKAMHRKRDPRPQVWHTGRPDADNVLKAVLDALNGIAYLDDRQVVSAQATKHRAAQGRPAGVWVEIVPVMDSAPSPG